MKQAFIFATLLMTSTLALAAESSNFVNLNDPAFSGKKEGCWKANATSGDTSQARTIHANSIVIPERPLERPRSSKDII